MADSAVTGRAQHVRSARVFQTSTFHSASASSTSMPRYLHVCEVPSLASFSAADHGRHGE